MKMNIQELIKEQNRAYVFAVNRKLGSILPIDLIEKQLTAGNDPHSIAKLIVKTKNALEIEDNKNTNPKIEPKVSSNFERFVKWIRRFKG
jgi:hypothetical protein